MTLLSIIGPADIAREVVLVTDTIVTDLYGTSTRLGKHACKAMRQVKLIAHQLDDPLQPTDQLDPIFETNPIRHKVRRLSSFDKKGTRLLPRKMNADQHEVLRTALLECRIVASARLIAEIESLGQRHFRVRCWRKLADVLQAFVEKLDAELTWDARAAKKKESEARRTKDLQLRFALARATQAVGLS